LTNLNLLVILKLVKSINKFFHIYVLYHKKFKVYTNFPILSKKYLDGLKFEMLLQLAVGPMCLMVFNTAKNVDFLVALTLVLAIALVDAFYIILASLGVSKIFQV
jgi:lysine exporter protein (LYSE/YGGA)